MTSAPFLAPLAALEGPQLSSGDTPTQGLGQFLYFPHQIISITKDLIHSPHIDRFRELELVWWTWAGVGA